jgi:predicted PurR-regulated permease PerM
MLEYLLNNYVLALVGVCVSLLITYLYDKFEKKQYSSSVYFKIAILTYIASLTLLFSFKHINNFLNTSADFSSNVSTKLDDILEPESIKNVVQSATALPNPIENITKTTSFSTVNPVSEASSLKETVKNIVSLDNQKFNIGTPTF